VKWGSFDMTQDPAGAETADDTKKLEFRLKLLREEIDAQANIFDQIDGKTGVALGFTFVVVGQVLASVFRLAGGEGHLPSMCPIVSNFTHILFVSANLCALLAIVFGAVARWPRGFEHSIEFLPDQLAGSYPKMLEGAVVDFGQIVDTNEAINVDKARWARRTYLFVGLTLSAYLVLTVLLYFVSVTK
jgi:hypothetical protein